MRLRVIAICVAALCAGALSAVATDQRGDLELANLPAGDTAGALRPPVSATPGDDRTLTIVFGGDLGLGGSDQPVHPDGAYRHGERHSWDKLMSGIKPLLVGDLNFANLETVVTARNDLSQQSKAFNFRTHPNGLRQLVHLGFNVLSAANNHAFDYGEEGLWETMRHLTHAEDHGLKAWHGLGIDRGDALRPAEMTIKGARVAFSAIGIGGRDLATRAQQPRPGMLSYHTDFEDVVAALAGVEADLRILSVHFGAEGQVRPSMPDVRRLRDVAARSADIGIVVGHHAHVAAGVQEVDGNLVFYGLGNLLHPGMQDMGRFNACRDYGLLARVHLSPDTTGQMKPRAIEAIPLTDMHLVARPMSADEARLRVEVLNHLAAGLNDAAAGASGVRFAAQHDGRGLHCLPGAANAPGHIGAMCRHWQPPAATTSLAARRAAAACGGSLLVARPRDGERQANRLKRSAPAWNLFQPW